MTNIIADTGTIKGRGVFAGQAYREGDVVEISPVILIEAEYDDLPRAILERVFDWEARYETEMPLSALALGHGSLFNHADKANMRSEFEVDKDQITFIAVRDIDIGEELTINYNAADGEPEWHDNNWFDCMGINPI